MWHLYGPVMKSEPSVQQEQEDSARKQSKVKVQRSLEDGNLDDTAVIADYSH
jgi:hypothetical protein